MNNKKDKKKWRKKVTPKETVGQRGRRKSNSFQSQFQAELERITPKNRKNLPGGSPGDTNCVKNVPNSEKEPTEQDRKNKVTTRTTSSTSKSTPTKQKIDCSSPQNSPSESRKNKINKKNISNSSTKKILERKKQEIIRQIIEDPIAKSEVILRQKSWKK